MATLGESAWVGGASDPGNGLGLEPPGPPREDAISPGRSRECEQGWTCPAGGSRGSGRGSRRAVGPRLPAALSAGHL